jgi:hypothetical protein
MHVAGHWICVVGCCAAVALGARAPADEVRWMTGAALEERLAAPVSVSWTNTPAGRALRSLAAAQQLAIVLDRRVDPDRQISLALAGEPLAAGLRKIAVALEAGYCQLGPIAYVGPPRMAQRLRTLAALRMEEVRRLPSERVREFLRLRASAWDDLAEPRKLLAELAEQAGVRLVGDEKVPHDLWPASDLPPLAWVDRLTLLLAQFNLTFRIEQDGNQVVLLPAPDRVALARTYQVPGQAESLAKRWARAIPAARVTADENTVRLEGLVEHHEYVERRFRGRPARKSTVTAGKEVHQLSVEEAALDQVVEQLAGRLNLEIAWDRQGIDRAGISVDQLISLEIKDADLDELLRAVLNGTGLAFRREDRKVSIYPADTRLGPR